MQAGDTYITDQDLLAALKGADAGAFNLLYHRHAAELTGFAASKLESLEEASDIIHDLFVFIWQERESLTIRTTFRSFLFAAVKYRIIDHIRKQSTRQHYSEMISRLAALSSPSTTPADLIETTDALNKAVEQLPPRMRDIFERSRLRQQSIAEIAADLNLSQQTVKNQLSAALSLLRDKLSAFTLLLTIL